VPEVNKGTSDAKRNVDTPNAVQRVSWRRYLQTLHNNKQLLVPMSIKTNAH